MTDKRINVLMMLDAFDIGGSETYVLSLTKQLLKQGVNVFVAGRNGPLRDRFRFLQHNLYNLNNDMSEFKRWIEEKKIHVIHAHLEDSALIAEKMSSKLNIPLIYTIHGIYYNRKTIRKIMNRCSIKPTFISVSLPVQEWLIKEKIPSIVIPNGIDTNEFRYVRNSPLREKFNIPQKSTVVLYASRLEDEKYKICKHILEITKTEKLLKKYPDLYLLVAGDGKNKNNIKKWIQKQKSSRIKFVGKQMDMSSLYSISNYVIGTGRVALEAMSCRRPVIAIGSEGTFGLVRPQKFKKAWKFYFCDHKKYRSLNKKNISETVKHALKQNLNKMNEGMEGRRFIQNQFHISIVANKVREVYEQRISEKRNPSYDKLMIVAHPDDETIFGGAQLLKEKGWKVICVTNGDNKVRRKEFKKVMKKVKAKFEIWRYRDKWNGDFDRTHLKYDLFNALNQNRVKKVVTHNAEGEYGHKQHKVLSRLIHRLVDSDLYVFHKSKGKLAKHVLKKKKKLLENYKSQDIGWLRKYIKYEGIKKVW